MTDLGGHDIPLHMLHPIFVYHLDEGPDVVEVIVGTDGNGD